MSARLRALPALFPATLLSLALLALALFALALLAPCAAHAEASLLISGQHRPLLVDLRPAGGDNDVLCTQSSVRATYSLDVSNKLTLVGQLGYATSFLEIEQDGRLTGLTDSRLRALYRPDDNWMLGGGAVLPSGLYKLSESQASTSGAFWNPPVRFPVSRFGEGLGWEGTAARSIRMGPQTVLGIAGAYLRHASYHRYSDTGEDYRLGDEASVTLALEQEFREARRLRLEATVKRYGWDHRGGTNTDYAQWDGEYVQQGAQLETAATLEMPMGALSTRWNVSVTFKGSNQFHQPCDTLHDGVQEPGTYLSFYQRTARAMGKSALLFVEARYSHLSGSDYLAGGTSGSLELGPGIAWEPSRSTSVSLTYNYVTGKWDQATTPIRFFGNSLEATLELRR